MADDPHQEHGADDAHGAADAHGAHDGHGDPFAADHLIGHVKDATYFEIPGGKINIPQLPADARPSIQPAIGFAPIDNLIQPLDLKITKFMVIEVIGALILGAIFVRLAGQVRTGERPKGRLWNMFEAMLVFIRDEVARPAIGKHDADRFLPFIWTIFFFVLICNLLGMVPWLGSPTGALATTGALALVTFFTVIGCGMKKMGVVKFWTGLVPHMDLHPVIFVLLWPMIFLIEILGLFIKHFVLSVRLLANMMAGHLVLVVILSFVIASANASVGLWMGISVASVLGATALSMLELFVAFLQAYIFAFLSALFIGMAVHPH